MDDVFRFLEEEPIVVPAGVVGDADVVALVVRDDEMDKVGEGGGAAVNEGWVVGEDVLGHDHIDDVGGGAALDGPGDRVDSVGGGVEDVFTGDGVDDEGAGEHRSCRHCCFLADEGRLEIKGPQFSEFAVQVEVGGGRVAEEGVFVLAAFGVLDEEAAVGVRTVLLDVGDAGAAELVRTLVFADDATLTTRFPFLGAGRGAVVGTVGEGAAIYLETHVAEVVVVVGPNGA